MGKKVKEKFNLTIIDRHPQIENFLYRGVTLDDRNAIWSQFSSGLTYISFNYDDGSAWVSRDCIHSVVFTEYVSEQEELEQELARPQDYDEAEVEAEVKPTVQIAHSGDLDDEDDL